MTFIDTGSAAVPATSYKVGSRETTSAKEGDEDLHWAKQDATRMVCCFSYNILIRDKTIFQQNQCELS